MLDGAKRSRTKTSRSSYPPVPPGKKMIRFPKPLQPGARIAITATSSGVRSQCHARLDRVLETLRRQGYEVVEGKCLRNNHREESAPPEERAAELMDFLTRPDIHAVLPPWGGERVIQLLPRLDFERLKSLPPKWFVGYSDQSTLILPMLLRAGWSCAHGPQLMDWAPNETDIHTIAPLTLMKQGLPFEQRASKHFIGQWGDIATDPDVTFHFTEPTRWQFLNGAGAPPEKLTIEGRILGGCLDTLTNLAGTPFGDVPSFLSAHEKSGVILFLENVELQPQGVLRGLSQLRLAGWMNGIRGLLIGRNANKKNVEDGKLTYPDALREALGDLKCPVIFDVDIGHVPPQLTIMEGALAKVTYADNEWRIEQREG
jgi:muramoyltetrapeptide carboxypeptidase